MHETVSNFVAAEIGSTLHNSLVVDVGARNVNGSLRSLIEGRARYIGVDLSPGESVDVIAYGQQLPFARIDLMLCCSVLEHTSCGEHICREAHRVLAPGGRFLVTTVDRRWPPHAATGGPLVLGDYYAPVEEAQLKAWLSDFARVDITTSEAGDVMAVARKRDRALSPVRLNLGAGNQRLQAGFVTIDANPQMDPDIVATLPPIPLPNESVSDIYASHFLEHLSDSDVIALMADAWRVLVPGGRLEVFVPYAFSHGAVQDPTHKSQWVPEKPAYFTAHFAYLGYGFEDRFRLVMCENLQTGPSSMDVHFVLEKVSVREERCDCLFCRASAAWKASQS